MKHAARWRTLEDRENLKRFCSVILYYPKRSQYWSGQK